MTTFREIIRGFNIFLIAIIALALAAASAISFLILMNVIAPADITPPADNWFREQLAALDGLSGTDETVAIAASLAAFAFALMLLVFESLPALMPSRLYGTDASGHNVMIDRRTIKQMVENSALDTENVTSANARLRDTNSGLHVMLKAGLMPDANITEAGRRLESKIKDDLRDNAGVSVSSVRLELEYAPQMARQRHEDKEHPRPV